MDVEVWMGRGGWSEDMELISRRVRWDTTREPGWRV